MIRSVTFDGTNERDRTLFTLLREAFLSRGNPKPEERQTKEDYRAEAKIKKQLDALSDPTGDAPATVPDTRPRVLKAETVDLRLEQPEFARLQRYVDSAQWTPHVVDLVMELADRLDAAEKRNEA